MLKVSGLIVSNSISERDFLAALDETDLVGGEVYPLVNGRPADVETTITYSSSKISFNAILMSWSHISQSSISPSFME